MSAIPAWLRALPPCLLLCASPVQAQAAAGNAIHWAYSTWFGSGWYRIGEDRDAFAIRYAPRITLRAPSSDDREHAVGIELRVPVTVGLDQFPLDDVAGTVDLGNLANVSVTPGIWVEVPVSARWSLQPFAAAGWGTVVDGGESAFSYWAGLKSRYVLDAGRVETALVNSAGFVGQSPNNGPSTNFWPLMTALEFGHPLRTLAGDDELRLNWHLSYTHFGGDLDTLARDATDDPINDQWEFGIAFSRRERSIPVWFLEFERLGLAYRRSSDGELQGIGLVFHSLFDQ